jgi:hypothetical protein
METYTKLNICAGIVMIFAIMFMFLSLHLFCLGFISAMPERF